MPPLKHLPLALACALAASALGCSAPAAGPSASAPKAVDPDQRHLLAFTASGAHGDPLIGRAAFNTSVAKLNPWEFKNNSRSCATCHIAGDGMGLGRESAYNAPPTSPLITAVLADGDPDVDFNSPYGQKLKTLMLDQLREVGLIRIVLPNPNWNPAQGDDPAHGNPKFIRTFRSVPTVFNAALGVSDAMPLANGSSMPAFVMWDGREPSLEHQAASATMGHAQTKLQQGPVDLRQAVNNPLGQDIAAFERSALSLPRSLATMKSVRPQQNHALDGTPWEGAPVFDLATLQKTYFSSVKLTTEAQKRGMVAFAGTPDHPNCIVCHNAPDTLSGGTRLFGDDNIGEENVQLRLHAPSPAMKAMMLGFGYEFEEGDTVQKLPTQTIKLRDQYGNYVPVTAQDFGLAGQTGYLKDLHKYKIPQLRGIKGFKRFFHDNYDETTLRGVVTHYEEAFPTVFHFTDQQRDDLVEFLKAL